MEGDELDHIAVPNLFDVFIEHDETLSLRDLRKHRGALRASGTTTLGRRRAFRPCQRDSPDVRQASRVQIRRAVAAIPAFRRLESQLWMRGIKP